MSENNESNGIAAFSDELALIVEKNAPAVVRVDDGSRLTATGVVWSSEGVIVTTSHGVERDEDLAIQTFDGKLHPVTLVGRDADTDIAVLKVAESGVQMKPLEITDRARVGNLVLTLARPGQSGLQSTLGIISSKPETERSGQLEYLLTTDADLYPGFSGAPLLDVQGKMVGMINLMFGRGKGIALGTPILSNVINSILKTGRVQRGFLGIRTQQAILPDIYLASEATSKQTKALLIVQVEPDSPAQKQGLFVGDLLLAFNGATVETVEDLRKQLRAQSANSEAILRLGAGGTVREVKVILGVEV